MQRPRIADELREHLIALDWSSGLFADALHEDKRLVRRWVQGTRPVPAIVMTWLRHTRRTCPNMTARRHALGGVPEPME